MTGGRLEHDLKEGKEKMRMEDRILIEIADQLEKQHLITVEEKIRAVKLIESGGKY